MSVEPLHNFEHLKDALKKRGYKIAEAQPWSPITGTDVGIEQFRTGQISFASNGGIELKADDGYTHIGFLYKRAYKLKEYGKPRMHLCKCPTIEDFIDKGSFETEYRFAETPLVMVIDKETGEDKEVSDLPLCKNCIRLLYFTKYSSVTNSEDFAALIKKTQDVLPPKDSEKDIFGYVKNWEQISRTYREEHEFRCEKCGVQITNPFDKKYIHVHHLNGKKADNRKSNLQCLCIRCHANIDNAHRTRFSRGGNAADLDIFNALYP